MFSNKATSNSDRVHGSIIFPVRLHHINRCLHDKVNTLQKELDNVNAHLENKIYDLENLQLDLRFGEIGSLHVHACVCVCACVSVCVCASVCTHAYFDVAWLNQLGSSEVRVAACLWLLYHWDRAAMSAPVSHEIARFKFVHAISSSCHSPAKQLQSAELMCIDEWVPQSGVLVAEYPEKYGCRFCDHTAVVLVSEMQDAKSYRMFCAVCFSAFLHNGWNELDVDTCCGKPSGGPFVVSVHEELLMHHVGNA